MTRESGFRSCWLLQAMFMPSQTALMCVCSPSTNGALLSTLIGLVQARVRVQAGRHDTGGEHTARDIGSPRGETSGWSVRRGFLSVPADDNWRGRSGSASRSRYTTRVSVLGVAGVRLFQAVAPFPHMPDLCKLTPASHLRTRHAVACMTASRCSRRPSA